MNACPLLRNGRSLLFLSILLPAVGCQATRVYEIDTAQADDFAWTGIVRITEKTDIGLSSLLHMRDATNAHAVELVGDGDRSVIIMPSGHSSPDHPVARVQYVGRPVDQVLALALSSEIRDLREMAADPRPARKSRIRKPTTTAPSEVETVADGRSSPDAPPVRTALLSESDLQRALVARSADHVDALKNLRLDDLNTNQAVIAAAAACKRTRVIYEMEDGTQIAAEYTLNDPTSYMADVYLPNGSHVYRYAPAPIPAKPVDWGVGIVKAGN